MSIDTLLAQLHEEAQREEFPIDREVYHAAKRDPLRPILYTGTLDAPLCFFARDLGRDEVHAGQPLYGAAGRLVRNGVHVALTGNRGKTPEQLQNAADQVLLTNTVPYKPPGNKAYSAKVKKRFRPFVTQLLLMWQGDYIIPLGTEALKWFMPYGEKSTMNDFIKDPQRFEKDITVTLQGEIEGKEMSKEVTIAPLPHPSPLNQKYYALFPEMLAARLKKVGHLLTGKA